MTLAFTGAGLDRADQLRSDPEALAARMDWRARLLKLDALYPVVNAEGGMSWGSLADADPDAELVFLGLDESGKACFVAVPSPLEGDPGPARHTWGWATSLSLKDMAIWGGARSLADWHARHRFCSRCGAGTTIAKGGWQRNCAGEACRAEHFPRVDPVTIMLVQHGDGADARLLLGRQPRFPPRRFSALAGFVEPGESIEEAVAREVKEEAGITVGDVRYIVSQPWPFPSSLMIGCMSYADDDAITLDETELEEARWFTRAEVVHALTGAEDGAFLAPPPVAVAHHLLAWWVDQGA